MVYYWIILHCNLWLIQKKIRIKIIPSSRTFFKFSKNISLNRMELGYNGRVCGSKINFISIIYSHSHESYKYLSFITISKCSKRSWIRLWRLYYKSKKIWNSTDRSSSRFGTIHYDLKNNINRITDPFDCVILSKPISLNFEQN